MDHLKILAVVVLTSFLIIGCQNEPSNSGSSQDTESTDTTKTTPPRPTGEGTDPCDYLNKSLIADHFAVDTSDVDLGARKGAGSQFSKTCIARWLTEENIRGRTAGSYRHNYPGIALQFNIWSDPTYPDNWAKNRVNAYLDKGVRVSGEASPYKFEEVEGLGDGAGWCNELSQLTWRKGTKAFDLYYYDPISGDQRREKAIAVAKDLMAKW